MTRDYDPYWDYDENDCWNCNGEGYVTGCSWDWQCDTYDEGEGTCLCSRRCDVCQPRPNANAELVQVLADALAAQGMSTGTAKTAQPVEGRSPASPVAKRCAQPSTPSIPRNSP